MMNWTFMFRSDGIGDQFDIYYIIGWQSTINLIEFSGSDYGRHMQ